MERALIAGVDPGTSIGYALLDLNGNFVRKGCFKGISLSEFVLMVIKHGDILIVGSDVNPAPDFVRKFSKRIGAKLVYPENDLNFRNRRNLLKGRKGNKHERAAICAACFAFDKMKPLIRKVESYLKREKKEEYSDKVKEILLRKEEASISEAVRKL